MDDKWLAALDTAIHGEMDRISQALTQRVKELAERYETPMPQLTEPRGRAGGESERPPGKDGVLMEVKPGYKQTEVGVIPEDWESTTVQQLASTVRNAIVGGPFGSELVSNDYVEEGVPVIRGQNMGSRMVSGRFVYVTTAKAHTLEANLAHPGDLVFTQRGTLGQVSLVPDAHFWPVPGLPESDEAHS